MKTKLLSLLFALVVGVNTVDAQMTVNGRPATKEEKAVAGQMVKQGVQMAKKGAQMAVTAVANPSKTDEIEKELRQKYHCVAVIHMDPVDDRDLETIRLKNWLMPFPKFQAFL